MPSFVIFPFIQCHHTRGRALAGGFSNPFLSESGEFWAGAAGMQAPRIRVPAKANRKGRPIFVPFGHQALRVVFVSTFKCGKHLIMAAILKGNKFPLELSQVALMRWGGPRWLERRRGQAARSEPVKRASCREESQEPNASVLSTTRFSEAVCRLCFSRSSEQKLLTAIRSAFAFDDRIHRAT